MPSAKKFLEEETRSASAFLGERPPGTVEERIGVSQFPPGTGGHPLARRATLPLLDLPRATPEEVAAGPTKAGAFTLRTAPGLVPAPGASAVLSGLGEVGAQFLEEGRITSPEQIGIATALPPAAAVTGRIARGIGRTMTRIVPSFFERAHRMAREAGEAIIQSLRPAEDAAQLAKSARVAGSDLIHTGNVQRIIGEIKIPPRPANPRLEAVKTTIENLKEALAAGGQIRLDDLEAIRRDIGPLLQSKAAPSELRGIYGAIVRDLEETAKAGGVGASLSREAATAFKQDLGAAKIAELFEKATSVRMVSGGNVPALDIARLTKLIRDPKTNKQLREQIGPDGLKLVDSFLSRFRSLPPTTAYNAWTTLLAALGGGVGAVAGETAVATGVGVISIEVMRNMAMVGANPKALNQILTTVALASRASQAEAMPTDEVKGALQSRDIPIHLKIEAALSSGP